MNHDYLEEIVDFELNIPQASALTVMPNETWALIGRGGGKTQGIAAPWILHMVEVMPRSSGGLIGTSFEDIESKILKPLFTAFGMMGHFEDVHYVYGKMPPADWAKPLIPVINYKHCVSWPNGTTMELISLYKIGSANGLSLQWLVGDEVKYFDEKQFNREVNPILRGNVQHFGHMPWYGAKLMITDKLAPGIHWLLAKRDLVDHDRVNAVMLFQAQLNELRLRKLELSRSQGAKLQKQVSKLETILAVLRKDLVYVVEASAEQNRKNLGDAWFENQKRTLTTFEYRIAVDNEDPTRVENNFYPDMGPKHYYLSDYDDDVSKPLGVVLDYQASISPLVSFQVNDQVVPGMNTLNFLENFFALYPEGLKSVIDKFCKRHSMRPCKKVYYFYDTTAINRKNSGKRQYEEVVEYFRANEWDVIEIYMGNAPYHTEKFRRIQYYLQQEDPTPYQVRIHKKHCATMILSCEQTGTKETDEGTKKDKSSERDINYPQEQATHFSDCFDQALWAVLEMNLYPLSVDDGGGYARR